MTEERLLENGKQSTPHHGPSDRQAALVSFVSCLLAFAFIAASVLAWLLSAAAVAYLVRRRWAERREKS